MNFLKSIWNFFFGWLTKEDIQTIMIMVIREVLREQFGRVTIQNFEDVINEAQEELQKTLNRHLTPAEEIKLAKIVDSKIGNNSKVALTYMKAYQRNRKRNG